MPKFIIWAKLLHGFLNEAIYQELAKEARIKYKNNSFRRKTQIKNMISKLEENTSMLYSLEK